MLPTGDPKVPALFISLLAVARGAPLAAGFERSLHRVAVNSTAVLSLAGGESNLLAIEFAVNWRGYVTGFQSTADHLKCLFER